MIGLKNFKKALQNAWDMRRGTDKLNEIIDHTGKPSQEKS